VYFIYHVGTMGAEHQQENHVRLGQSSRKLQQVCTLSAKKAVVEWMVEDSTWNTERRLISRAIQAFPKHFRGSPRANYMKAYQWWIDQNSLFNFANNANPISLHMTCIQVGKWCKTHLKARSG
jgi:hypothetical protein